MKGMILSTTAVGARLVPISRMYERSKMWPIEKDTTAEFGSNPDVESESFFDIFMQGPNASVDPGSVDFIINIIYYVTCFELKQFASF